MEFATLTLQQGKPHFSVLKPEQVTALLKEVGGCVFLSMRSGLFLAPSCSWCFHFLVQFAPLPIPTNNLHREKIFAKQRKRQSARRRRSEHASARLRASQSKIDHRKPPGFNFTSIKLEHLEMKFFSLPFKDSTSCILLVVCERAVVRKISSKATKIPHFFFSFSLFGKEKKTFEKKPQKTNFAETFLSQQCQAAPAPSRGQPPALATRHLLQRLLPWPAGQQGQGQGQAAQGCGVRLHAAIVDHDTCHCLPPCCWRWPWPCLCRSRPHTQPHCLQPLASHTTESPMWTTARRLRPALRPHRRKQRLRPPAQHPLLLLQPRIHSQGRRCCSQCMPVMPP